MTPATKPQLLILETSGRVGQVALAQGVSLVQVRRLDQARRHARDLAPSVAELLQLQGWRPRDLDGVIVSRGPGSYTGLRVGLMAAKTLAYAVNCAVIAVDTFAAIALQAPAEAQRLHVVADAQQDKLYLQPFERSGEDWWPTATLTIVPFAEWLPTLQAGDWVSGPGLRNQEDRLPAIVQIVENSCREPQPGSLLKIGLVRYHRDERDDLWALEPLYLRPSAAEEKWRGA